MLRVEVVSANNIKRNYVYATVEAAVNGTQALAPERRSSGSLGVVEINRQFFVPPQHQLQDIVFVAKLYQVHVAVVSALACSDSSFDSGRMRRPTRC